jgi:hypothetical protein
VVPVSNAPQIVGSCRGVRRWPGPRVNRAFGLALPCSTSRSTEDRLDKLQFISSLLGTLAWPLTLIGAVLLVRKPLLALLPSLRSLEYDKLKVQFGEQLEKAEADLSKLPTVIPAAPSLDNASAERFEATANVAPNLAVLQAWFDVEAELKSAAVKVGIEFKRSSPLDAARSLQREGLLDEQTAELMRDLRNMRNLAVHPDEARPITFEQAQRYKLVADRIISALRASYTRPPS